MSDAHRIAVAAARGAAAAVEASRGRLNDLNVYPVPDGDTGAAGLVEFCRGAVAGARGEQIQAPLEALERPLSFEAVHQEASEFRYCTSFLLEGDDIDRDRLEGELLAMGDCLLVVGEAP